MRRATLLQSAATLMALALATASPAAEKTASPPKPGATLVTVNGKVITPELYAAFRRTAQASRPAGESQAESQLAILNQLVNFILLSQDAERRALDRKPLVAARVDVARARVLASAAIADYLSRVQIPETVLKKAYAERFKGTPLTEYRVRHILRKSRDEAADVIRRLQQGEAFTTLMQNHAADGEGGELGWMSPGQMEPAIERAVAALQPGEYTAEPVQTDYGWHVVQLEEKRQIPQPSYGEMRASLLQEAQQARLSDYIRTLRSQADLEVGKAAVGAPPD